MFKYIKKIFDYNTREVERLRKKVSEINALEDNVRDLKDADFPRETAKLKQAVQSTSQTLDAALPWAFALVREAARRTLNQRHFDVQLIAAIALHEGKVVEQKTGEGKTLTATAALYLNALAGKGVHLVTVNDYLARRDAGWMGIIFHFLGLTTAAMISEQSYIYDPEFMQEDAFDWRLKSLKPVSRTAAYAADITYGINSEFGFDYLRDNMAQSADQQVQRGFYFAIIDEADSVLIDEARTPHIISAPYEQDTSKYYQYAKLVKHLDTKTDYVVDEKLRTANITESGIARLESLLGIQNIYEKDFDTIFHIEAALKAETLYKKDKEYIVKDGEVIIVDEFTGRLLQGRRFSEGLHQAIEAKENVAIQRESKTLATVSLQNYFRMYAKLAGMTGTAATEAEEFHKIYKTDVLVIPTHKTMIRNDRPDMIYKTEKAKYNAVAEEIGRNYKLGRPVLVGTTSIEKNEYLSNLLRQKGVPHELLNAKNHVSEAKIIAAAGKKGAVTVATNMAGRGVDILLGGSPPEAFGPTQNKSKQQADEYHKAYNEWSTNHEEVLSLGGLYVIGTERHESRRIDNQLRGRSGRQGDPGETCFFVSLEDDLMRIFGGEQISRLMTFFNFPEDQPLSHAMVSKAIEQAQVKVEGFNFDIRKHLVDFDDVLNKQREIIYVLRRSMVNLAGEKPEEFRSTVFDIFHQEISGLLNTYALAKDTLIDEELDLFTRDLDLLLPRSQEDIKAFIKKRGIDGLQKHLEKKIADYFAEKEQQVGQQVWFDVIRAILLSTIDQYWTEHLTAIEDLREGINLRGYAQLDPLVEYKNEAYSMFEKLVNDINFEVSRRIFHVQVSEDSRALHSVAAADKPLILKSASRLDPFAAQPQKQVQEAEIVNENQGFKVVPPGSQARKLGRNDPCWCGSGKKYKKCHWPD